MSAFTPEMFASTGHAAQCPRNNASVLLAGGTEAVNAVLVASAVVPPIIAVLVARVAWIWAKTEDEGEGVAFRDVLRKALWLDRTRATRSSRP
jgi:NaMN:DMB phosphoribosyltransferase